MASRSFGQSTLAARPTSTSLALKAAFSTDTRRRPSFSDESTPRETNAAKTLSIYRPMKCYKIPEVRLKTALSPGQDWRTLFNNASMWQSAPMRLMSTANETKPVQAEDEFPRKSQCINNENILEKIPKFGFWTCLAFACLVSKAPVLAVLCVGGYMHFPRVLFIVGGLLVLWVLLIICMLAKPLMKDEDKNELDSHVESKEGNKTSRREELMITKLISYLGLDVWLGSK